MILKHFKTPDFSNYRDLIGGWSRNRLQSIINPLFEMYLDFKPKNK